MTRGIEYRISYPWPVPRVLAALMDADCLRERVRMLDGDSELIEHVATEQGVWFRISHGVRAEAIPSAARALAGGAVVINRSERWYREDDGTYTGEVTAGTAVMPRFLTASQWLRDLPGVDGAAGCEFAVSGSVQLHIPLLGRKLEDLFAGEMRGLLEGEHAFTVDWLSRDA